MKIPLIADPHTGHALAEDALFICLIVLILTLVAIG
jgi:hypothetical protein